MARKKKTKQEHDVLLVTQSGYDEMVQELSYRTGELRDQIADEINEARNLGDLSENQAYSEAVERKNMNEGRIEELEQLITVAQIIQKDATGVVGIGSVVQIQNVQTKQSRTITIVGREIAQEADPREGKISIDSPLGSSLRGKKKGDTVEVQLPVGAAKYEVKGVES